METMVVSGAHPTELSYHQLVPSGSPRGVVQLAHGMAEHLGRYRDFAEFLVDEGWVVVGADHRGHGESANADAPLGYFGDGVTWEDVVEDLHQVRTRATLRFPDVPYVVFGHSMGSMLVRCYIAKYGAGLAGAAIIGTGLWPGLVGELGLTAANVLSAVAPRRPGGLLDRLTFGNYNADFEKRTRFDWLSRDRAGVDAYIADPKSGYLASNAFFKQLFRGLKMATVSPEIYDVPRGLPLYIASGELDPVGGKTVVATLAARYCEHGAQDVETHVYPEDRHEILLEVDKERVWADFVTWLNRIS